MKKITPCIWFDGEAEQVARFYVSVFPNSKIKSIEKYNTETPSNKPIGSVLTVTFEINGQEFMTLNGGNFFKVNPSISFHIRCNSIEKVDSYYKKLSKGGKILMELNEYPFSKKYAWIEDKYGVSWQIIYTDKKITQEIVPALMFTQDLSGKSKEAIRHYTQVFPESKIKQIVEYGKNKFLEKENNVMYSEFILAKQEFIAMDSSMNHKFKVNEAISFIIPCKDQKEMDYYYKKLSAFPESEMCGWLKDKFGVSWQLVTKDFEKLMTGKNAKKVMNALLEMKRLDVKELERIHKGKQ